MRSWAILGPIVPGFGGLDCRAANSRIPLVLDGRLFKAVLFSLLLLLASGVPFAGANTAVRFEHPHMAR